MRSALAFLTVWPVSARPHPRASLWFSPVGALIGLAVGATWWAADQIWPPLIAAVLAIVIDAALTGMLHLDGLADSGDGLLPPMDRERRLAVMRDPHIGAFGVVTVVSTLLLRIGALATLTPDPLLIAGLWAASRAVMTVTLLTVPYARPDGGLGSAFLGDRPSRTGEDDNPATDESTAPPGAPVVTPLVAGVTAGLAALVLVTLAVGIPAGLAAAGGLLAGSAGVVLLAHRRLGGFTGDVLGAAGIIGETCGLLLAAARW